MPNPGENVSEFSYTGIYRALVVNARDPEKRGRVKIWCPDTMPEIDQNRGLWASSANNPLGGRNTVDNRLGQGNDVKYGKNDPVKGGEHYFQGSCLIPPEGSWVYIFFEYGNPNEPRYLAGGDFGQCKVLVENQQGPEYEKKWTLLKTRQGRTIILSDDPFDERVEITGKKRLLTPDDVSGNVDSVYKISDNQTVILLDERKGQEKILIKDYKGNFFNFNIETNSLHVEFAGDIHIKAGGSIHMTAGAEMHFKSGDVLNVTSDQTVNIKSGGQVNIQSSEDINIKAGSNLNEQAGTNVNIRAGANINEDGILLLQQQGAASSASSAESATVAVPLGDRVEPTDLSQPSDIDDDAAIARNIAPATKAWTDTPDIENGTNNKRT